MRRTRTRELQQFERELRTIIGDGVELRPFVCGGSPLECEILIVGLNAATELGHSFWEFWQPDVGFNRAAWLENYKAERESKLLAEGKIRRVVVSPTRRAIEEIIYAALPIKCLETNLYGGATARAQELLAEQRDTRIFDFFDGCDQAEHRVATRRRHYRVSRKVINRIGRNSSGASSIAALVKD